VLWIERAKTRAGDRRLELTEVLRPRLAALIAGRDPRRTAVRRPRSPLVGYHVRRLCGWHIAELGAPDTIFTRPDHQWILVPQQQCTTQGLYPLFAIR
jgi:hypothetical protein